MRVTCTERAPPPFYPFILSVPFLTLIFAFFFTLAHTHTYIHVYIYVALSSCFLPVLSREREEGRGGKVPDKRITRFPSRARALSLSRTFAFRRGRDAKTIKARAILLSFALSLSVSLSLRHCHCCGRVREGEESKREDCTQRVAAPRRQTYLIRFFLGPL